MSFIMVSFILLFVIAFFVQDHVIINEYTNWAPLYTVEFFVFFLIFMLSNVIFAIFMSVHFYYNRLISPEIRKKWKLISIGTIGLPAVSIQAVFFNSIPIAQRSMEFLLLIILIIPLILCIFIGLEKITSED